MTKRDQVNGLLVGKFAEYRRKAIVAALSEEGAIEINRTPEGRAMVNDVPLGLITRTNDMFAGEALLLNVIERVFGSTNAVTYR